MTKCLAVRPGIPDCLLEQPLPVIQDKADNGGRQLAPLKSPPDQCPGGLVRPALFCGALLGRKQALPELSGLGIAFVSPLLPLLAEAFDRFGAAGLETGRDRDYQGVKLVQ